MSEDVAEVTRSELTEEIAARRRLLCLLIEEIADHQAILQRLQVERSVLEGELRAFEKARKCARRR